MTAIATDKFTQPLDTKRETLAGLITIQPTDLLRSFRPGALVYVSKRDDDGLIYFRLCRFDGYEIRHAKVTPTGAFKHELVELDRLFFIVAATDPD